MKSKTYTIVRLFLGMLTVLALIGLHYIPPKIHTLTPSDVTSSSVYGLPREGNRESSVWIDEEKRIFSCEFAREDPYSCGYALSLSPNGTHGLDLSNYDGLNILLRYAGNAPEIRLSLRHYNEQQHDPSRPAESSKFMSVLVRAKDLNHPAYVSLSEFGVAEWWVRQYDASRKHSAPEFINIISVGLDFVTHSSNVVTVEKVELVGRWVRKETFYLLLIALWMVLVLSEGITKVYAMYQDSRSASRHIEKLTSDYKKLEVEKREFESLSITDALTGVMNRAGVQQFLEKLADGNFGGQTGMLLFDIDHFKRINDCRGHDAGDRILQGVAKLIQQNVRPTDVFGRWGGEEFILISPQGAEEALTALAEKLRANIHAHTFEQDSDPVRVSVSIGATLARTNEPFDATFKRVDVALYEAKNSGRNCVVFK